jgi:hypothetical protein
MLAQIAQRLQPAICINRKHRHTPVFVVRDEHVPARRIDAQMARLTTHRRLAAEPFQRSTPRIDGVRRDSAPIASKPFTDREQEFPRRMKLEPRWIDFRGRRQTRQFSRGWIVAEDLNSLRPPSAGIRADINQMRRYAHTRQLTRPAQSICVRTAGHQRTGATHIDRFKGLIQPAEVDVVPLAMLNVKSALLSLGASAALMASAFTPAAAAGLSQSGCVEYQNNVCTKWQECSLDSTNMHGTCSYSYVIRGRWVEVYQESF